MGCANGNRHIIAGRLRYLLATSSFAALLLGSGTPPAFAACAINDVGSTFGPVSNAGAINCINVQNSTVTGSVTNTSSGTLTPVGLTAPTATGITIDNSSIGGSVSNAGTITAPLGTGIVVKNNASVAGGVVNTNAITAGLFGVNVVGDTTLGGGISNSGSVSVVGTGMIAAFVGTFSGGMSNSGTVTAGLVGIAASGDLSFSGGIANAATGKITGANAGISVTQVSTFLGGISNAGTITVVHTGIFVDGGNTFGGGIANSGTISASNVGIQIGLKTGGGTLFGVTSFGGNVSNSGTIAAAIGIEIVGSTINGAIVDSGTLTASSRGILIDNASKVVSSVTAIKITGPTFSGGISNAGVVAGHSKAIFVQSTASFGGGIANTGSLSSISTAVRIDTVSQFAGGISNGGTISGADIGVFAFTVSTFIGGISNTGVVSGGTNALAVGTVTNFAGSIVNTGTLSSVNGNGIAIAGVSTFGGNVSNAATITAKTGIKINAGVTFAGGGAVINSGNITGSVAAIDASAATSAVTIDQLGGALSGAIKLSSHADVLNISGGAVNGNIVGQGSSDTVNFALGSGTLAYNEAFTGINQVNINSGTIVLNGANSAAKVDVLGGTLAGSGSIDPTLVTIHSGATFAPGAPGVPGTSMSIVGNLAFQSGAFYLVALNSSASAANVSGSAALAGTVEASFAGAVSKTYTILSANGGLGGTTFSSLTNINLPAGASDSLSYDADHVYLNVTAPFGSFTGLNINQQNVANGLTNAFNANGSLPAQFFGLTPAGLTQVDGEDATDAEKGAFQLMNDFLNLLLDPVAGAGGGANGVTPAFAPAEASLPPDIAQAYAGVLKAAPSRPSIASGGGPGWATFDQRWTAWGSAFGGTSRTNGDPVVGSNNVTASDYGFAAGMEYRLTPDTAYGFALAGGGTNWNLAQGLGSGRSDSFTAGVYAKTHFGPAYLSGALAFANHWFTTDRIALGDQLRASFTGQSYAARLEGGYRYAVPITGAIVGVTPYAALQAQNFHTPSYSETDLTGGGFGLSYASMNATDTRSELGARFDNLQVVGGMPLVLRGRLAWAHDWVSNPALGAVFQILPGSNFVVNGAAPPKNSALTTAAAELHITSNWTAIAKFDGDFGAGSQTYGGTGILRYSW